METLGDEALGNQYCEVVVLTSNFPWEKLPWLWEKLCSNRSASSSLTDACKCEYNNLLLG
jgi:hypothetical protein